MVLVSKVNYSHQICQLLVDNDQNLTIIEGFFEGGRVVATLVGAERSSSARPPPPLAAILLQGERPPRIEGELMWVLEFRDRFHICLPGANVERLLNRPFVFAPVGNDLSRMMTISERFQRQTATRDTVLHCHRTAPKGECGPDSQVRETHCPLPHPRAPLLPVQHPPWG